MSGSGQGNWGPPQGGGPFGPPGGFGQPPGGFGQPPGGGYGQPPWGGGFGQPPNNGYWPPGGQAAPPPQKKPNRAIVIVLAIVGITVLCAVCGVAGYLHDKNTQATYGALTAACEGRPVPGARPYAVGPGVHRVVGARPSNGAWHIENGRIPSEQLAQGVSDAEVVMCLGEETRATLDTCSFYRTRLGMRVPGSDMRYTRTRQSLPVRLVIAATGQTLVTGSVLGPAPIQCSQNIGRPSPGTFEGSSVGSAQVGPWLSATLASGGTGMVPMN